MTREKFEVLLVRHDKIVVTGMPVSGKTIYTEMVRDRHLLHTDHLSHIPFSDRWDIVASELSHYLRWVLAGVLAPHVLVKTGIVPDVVVWLQAPRAELSDRQRSFGKGVRTLFYRWKRMNPGVPVEV